LTTAGDISGEYGDLIQQQRGAAEHARPAVGTVPPLGASDQQRRTAYQVRPVSIILYPPDAQHCCEHQHYDADQHRCKTKDSHCETSARFSRALSYIGARAVPPTRYRLLRGNPRASQVELTDSALANVSVARTVISRPG